MSNTRVAQQVFVIGCPRSGTSALSWALAEHPKMWTSAESDFMHQMFKGNMLFDVYKNSMDRPDTGWLKKNGVTYREFASYFGVGIDAMFRSRSRGLIWVDQTPGHTLVAPVLHDMFPDAKFIHIVRDGKRVVNSMLNSGFQNIGFKMKWTTDCEQACNTWSTYVKRGSKFVDENPEVAIQIKNEDMSKDTETTFSIVQKFLGLDVADGPSKFISSSRLNSSFDKGFKVNKKKCKSVDDNSFTSIDWTENEIALFDSVCLEMTEKLGYQTTAINT